MARRVGRHWMTGVAVVLGFLAGVLPAWAGDAGAPAGSAAPPAEAAAAPAAAPATPQQQAVEVYTGIFINDIQDIDFRTNSFTADFYVWFRWKDEALDPSKSMEFMNRYQPTEHLRESLHEVPKVMPDGSRYAIVRSQGRFSAKFDMETYPFDEQRLAITFEDTVNGSTRQVYAPDVPAVTLNPDLRLPGFRIGKPKLVIIDNLYPTNFGDKTVAEQESYSRATLYLPISRHLDALSLKMFVPVILIIFCSVLALFVRPAYVDGRIGLAITALLTLVALQLTSGSSLPDVDYLMTIDMVYLVSYAFILLVLLRIASTSWWADNEAHAAVAAKTDRRLAYGLGVLYVLALAGIGATMIAT